MLHDAESHVRQAADTLRQSYPDDSDLVRVRAHVCLCINVCNLLTRVLVCKKVCIRCVCRVQTQTLYVFMNQTKSARSNLSSKTVTWSM